MANNPYRKNTKMYPPLPQDNNGYDNYDRNTNNSRMQTTV